MRCPPIPVLAAAAALAAPPLAHAVVCTPTVQWIWDGATQAPSYREPCTTPLVMQLTDDNGDSVVDAADDPDVVFTHHGGSAVITVVDGATGVEHFTTQGATVTPSALAGGDINGDGLVELVGIESTFQNLVAFDNTGQLLWRSAPSPMSFYEFESVNMADLDQDGSVEIFVGATVFNSDGSFKWQGTAGSGVEQYWGLIHLSHAVDVMPTSPGLELLAGNTLYDAQGNVLWQVPGVQDGWTAAADFDLDGDAEIVLTGLQDLYMLDHLGNIIGGPYTVAGRLLRQPVIDDVDGDGQLEVVIVQSDLIVVLDWDGTAFRTAWSRAVDDFTGVTGPVTYDFDGDGAAEIVYHDERDWYIFDGAGGAVLSTFPFNSATLIETPVVADIDKDCIAEILISGCQGGVPQVSPNQVIAYECSPSVTPRAMWNQHSYHVTNVNDDGTIPQMEQAPWLAQNSWFGQIASPGGPNAEAGADQTVCLGEAVVLDGSASSGCGGNATWRWLEGANVVCNWSISPTCTVTPVSSPTVYTVEMSCGGSTACTGTDTVTVTVETPPAAEAGTDRSVCAGDTAVLDASGSSGCSGTAMYRWLDGVAVVCNWSATAQCSVSPAATTTYTVEVSCGGSTTCLDSDTVTVTVDPVPVAEAGADLSVCAGQSAVLDGSGSAGCPGNAMYRWLDGATVVCNWSATPQCNVSPAASTVYTLEVQCGTVAACAASDTVPVTVTPTPTAVAGPDRSVCERDVLLLDGSGSSAPGCTGGLLYEWREGPTVVRPWSTTPTWQAPTAAPRTTTYTLAVACAATPGCEATDPVFVEVRSCPLAVRYSFYEARFVADGSGRVAVAWGTASEEDTSLFLVERSVDGGAFVELEPPVVATGSGSSYRFVDQPPRGELRYRVTELTSNGYGDRTPELVPEGGESAGRGSRARARRTR